MTAPLDPDGEIDRIFDDLRGAMLGRKSWEVNPYNTDDPQVLGVDQLLSRHKSRLLDMLREAREDELLRLPKNKLRDHINEAGQRKDIAIVNYKFVEDRIKQLKRKS